MIDLYVEDNITLMQRLPSEFIQLIYVDILFGTNQAFEDYNEFKDQIYIKYTIATKESDGRI